MTKIKSKIISEKKYILNLVLLSLGIGMLSACSNVNYIESNREYDQPPAAVREKLKMFMPMYEAWLNSTIVEYNKYGTPLSEQDVQWAKTLGIQNISQIKIVRRDFFPMPDNLFLSDELERVGMGSPYEDARNMGYLIFIRPDFDTPQTRAHQLAKIYLMEKLGAARFIYRQLSEMRMVQDKKDQPLNIEASRLVKCLPENGKITLACKIGGNRPENGQDNTLFKKFWGKNSDADSNNQQNSSTFNQSGNFQNQNQNQTSSQQLQQFQQSQQANQSLPANYKSALPVAGVGANGTSKNINAPLNFEQAIKKSAAPVVNATAKAKEVGLSSLDKGEKIIKTYELEKSK